MSSGALFKAAILQEFPPEFVPVGLRLTHCLWPASRRCRVRQSNRHRRRRCYCSSPPRVSFDVFAPGAEHCRCAVNLAIVSSSCGILTGLDKSAWTPACFQSLASSGNAVSTTMAGQCGRAAATTSYPAESVSILISVSTRSNVRVARSCFASAAQLAVSTECPLLSSTNFRVDTIAGSSSTTRIVEPTYF